ncbi:MAG TPA: SH3 domain-containing protein [Balneolaceae bacterium]|nr:SH3 domain-containing protein [Balneolaceae bacterium]
MNKKSISLLIILLGLTYGCSSSSWKKARQADTYKAYQNYIKNNPHGKHLAEAKKLAETRYWTSIKNDSTAKPFQQYLDQFPDGQFRSQAQARIKKIKLKEGHSIKGRVTGSGVIIRSDHTTSSASKGVVAKKGTIVQILDQYSTKNSNEAILKHAITVTVHGKRIHLAKGKAIRILSSHNDSVSASFSTSQYGLTKATINQNDIEAMSGQKWYKIRTTDNITGWIYGKYIKEL